MPDGIWRDARMADYRLHMLARLGAGGAGPILQYTFMGICGPAIRQDSHDNRLVPTAVLMISSGMGKNGWHVALRKYRSGGDDGYRLAATTR